MSGFPFYPGTKAVVYNADALEILKTLPDCSIDAVVTDPPYGLSKEPDMAEVMRHWIAGDDYVHKGNGFMGKSWDSFVPGPSVWRECLRVLKPGGHLLCFAGARTQDLMGLSIRLAGFEIRDSIAWLYGSGFPKSLDVSKVIDKAAGAEREVIGVRGKSGSVRNSMAGDFAGGEYMNTAPATEPAQQWQGWGTALKPAFEPVVVARKPLAGTVAANVQEHGTGALNIDGCRVHADDAQAGRVRHGGGTNAVYQDQEWSARTADQGKEMPAGRWPTNVVLDESQAAELDQQTDVTTSSGGSRGQGGGRGAYGVINAQPDVKPGFGDTGGASRFFPVFKYQAKAPAKERPKVDGVAHPTVKPLELMRWLVRLVTPPGGVVLEPFAGSGTTVEAALLEGFHCVAIEREADYLPLIFQRIYRSTPGLGQESTA